MQAKTTSLSDEELSISDATLIAQLRGSCFLAFDDGTNEYASALDAADRIEALVKERDRFEAALGRACLVGGTTYLVEKAQKAEARAERLEAALTQIVEKQFVRTMSYDRSAQFYAAAVGELKEIAHAALEGANHDR